MQHARPERHELVCGRPHLVSLMMGKIVFCRRCGLAFLPSGLKQHDEECQILDNAKAMIFDEERVKKRWQNFRGTKKRKKRNKMKRLGDERDFDSLDPSELAAEFNLYNNTQIIKKSTGNSDEADIEKILWPRFLKEHRMKRKKRGLVADNYGMDMNDSRLKGEFDLWLEDKKRSKCQSLKSSYNKICGKCGQAFSPSRIEQHEAKCGNLANEVLCTENHEHQHIEKAFDSMEDAVAFFYDNEYDSELNIREAIH